MTTAMVPPGVCQPEGEPAECGLRLAVHPGAEAEGTFDGLKGWNGYGSSSAVKVDEETDDDIVFVNKSVSGSPAAMLPPTARWCRR